MGFEITDKYKILAETLVTTRIFLTLYMQYGGFWCILATRISPEDVVPMVHFLTKNEVNNEYVVFNQLYPKGVLDL